MLMVAVVYEFCTILIDWASLELLNPSPSHADIAGGLDL
jgi:hypothetical protein